MRYNIVETRDSRVNFLAPPETYEFLDFYSSTSYIGPRYLVERSIKYPEDPDFVRRSGEALHWGMYFFYSEQMYSHSRTMQNYFNILSEFGGLTEILVYSIGAFVIFANKRFERAKHSKSMYFKSDPED